MPDIGTITIQSPDGTPGRTLQLTDLVRATYKDHRFCTVARAEDNTFLLAVENPASTGRATLAQMYLSEESMLAIASCIFLFYQHKGIDVMEKFQEIATSPNLSYEYAPAKEQ